MHNFSSRSSSDFGASPLSLASERAGGQACGVDEVGTGEGLPGIADESGMLDILCGQADLVTYDFGRGGLELAFVLGNLKGARGLAVGGVEPLGIVEADESLVALNFYRTEEGTAGRQAVEPVVVVEGEGGQTVAEGAFRAEVNVERVAEVGGDGHARMGETGEQAALRIAEPGP